MGDPVVFIPGLACTEDLFSHQIRTIAATRTVVLANHRRHATLHDLVDELLGELPERFALVGLSMGGYIAFLAACRTNTDATVAYHGGGIHTALGEAGGIKKPVMLHNPLEDSFIPREALDTIRETLKPNPLVTVHEYAGLDHAFTR